MSQPCCPVLSVLSHPSCLPILSCLSCPSCSASLLLSTAHVSPLSGPCCRVLASCPLCPVLSDMSWLTCQANLSRLTCLGYPAQHHKRCHVPDVMPQLYCQGCPATVVPSQLSCPSFPFLLLCSGHPVLSFLSCLYHPNILPAVLSQLSCPSILVPSSYPCCPVFVVMLSLPCPTVLGALSSKSFTDCPVLTVQGRPYMAE